MPRLVIICPDAEAYEACIARELPELEIAVGPPDEPAAQRALVREADLLLAWRCSRDLLADAPRLRWIQSFGAGVDHLLDLEIPPGVIVTRIVGAFSASMAEYVVGYAFASRLQVRRILEQQRQAAWKPFNAPLLRGSTAVVVGLGSIGREVCRCLRAVGLRVLGVSRSGRPIDEADQTFPVEQLEAALPAADFLVLVAPLTPATRGLIGARQLARLPRHAWLFNLARGPLVVEQDLLAALRAGRLGGAVLDVFEREPLPPEHPFWSMEQVIVTPHLAGPDEVETVAEQFVANYRRFAAGEPLVGLVDLRRGY
jgi:glyoxylate/hydroxypyruvate reductase A